MFTRMIIFVPLEQGKVVDDLAEDIQFRMLDEPSCDICLGLPIQSSIGLQQQECIKILVLLDWFC